MPKIHDLSIRDFQKGDAERASQLIMNCFNTYLKDTAEAGKQVFAEVAAPRNLLDLHKKGHTICIAGHEEEMIGILAMGSSRHLLLLFVDGDYHRQGVAKHLWAHTKALCTSFHPGEEPFTVNSSDYALKVYERLGFLPTGPRAVKGGLAFTPMEMPSSCSQVG